MADLDHTCPYCQRINQAAEGPEPGMTPGPGDVSLCWRCGGIALFTDQPGVMRLPTPDELDEIEADPGVQKARAAIDQANTPSEATRIRRGDQ